MRRISLERRAERPNRVLNAANRHLPRAAGPALVACGFLAVCLVGRPSVHGGTGTAAGDLAPPLHHAWTFRAACPPIPAFRGELPETGWKNRNLPMYEPITYDYAHPVIAVGGRVYASLTGEEAVVCLDGDSGAERWRFHANGPVRFAPSYRDGALYFGSDDGCVYCLDAKTGSLRWQFNAAPGRRRCVGSHRVMSAWPVRTSVAISPEEEEKDFVYFGSGLFTTLGTFIFAVDAGTGEPIWKAEVKLPPHGEILVTSKSLLVATGRTAPAEYSRDDGSSMMTKWGDSALRAHGGTTVRQLGAWQGWGVSEGGMFFLRDPDAPPAEPGNRGYRGHDLAALSGVISGFHSHSLVEAGGGLCAVRDDAVVRIPEAGVRQIMAQALKGRIINSGAFGRSGGGRYENESSNKVLREHLDAAFGWSVENTKGWKRIARAGDTLFVGGPGDVSAIDANTGKVVWSAEVEGEVFALACGDGRVVVSTDQGNLCCFSVEPGQRFGKQGAPTDEPAWDSRHAETCAAAAVKYADTRKGFAFVLGAADGRLGREIARTSDLFAVVLERDAAAVERARRNLTLSGDYGTRVVVHHVPDAEIDYALGLGNVVVVNPDAEPAPFAGFTADSVLELVQPYGGVLLLPAGGRVDHPEFSKALSSTDGPLRVFRRGALCGAGSWSHMYADPGNTVCSGDELVSKDQALQWFGGPGPKHMVDRHDVPHPPLAVAGRLFISGVHNTIEALDSYNGTRLWRIDAPQSVRPMASHQAAMMSATPDHVFVASGPECRQLDAATGKTVHTFRLPDATDEADWGHVGVIGDVLLGSTEHRAALDAARRSTRSLVFASSLYSRPTVSRDLFVYRVNSGSRLWRYENASRILNTTITVGGGLVYFAESTNAEAWAAAETPFRPAGAADLSKFFATGASLVALDLETGVETWRKPLRKLSQDPKDSHEHIMFLSFSDGILLSTRTGHISGTMDNLLQRGFGPKRSSFGAVFEENDGTGTLGYELRTYSANTGEPVWTQHVMTEMKKCAPLSYGKNLQQSHPAIVEGTIHLLPFPEWLNTHVRIDLKTGEVTRKDGFLSGGGKGCAVPTASQKLLFFRRATCHFVDLESGIDYDMTGITRPACYMSMVAADGLILMPEGSAVCTCGLPLQTSVAFTSANARP